MNLAQSATAELVIEYNRLVQTARKVPNRLRPNCMPRQASNRQLLLDELHRRASQGDNHLHKLVH